MQLSIVTYFQDDDDGDDETKRMETQWERMYIQLENDFGKHVMFKIQNTRISLKYCSLDEDIVPCMKYLEVE